MKSGFSNLFDGLGAGDSAAVIKFGSEVEVTQGFTADKTLLKNAIAAPFSQGSTTRLYDATVRAANDAALNPGRLCARRSSSRPTVRTPRRRAPSRRPSTTRSARKSPCSRSASAARRANPLTTWCWTSWPHRRAACTTRRTFSHRTWSNDLLGNSRPSSHEPVCAPIRSADKGRRGLAVEHPGRSERRRSQRCGHGAGRVVQLTPSR